MINFTNAVDKYYVRSATGATVDLVTSYSQAAKIAKENRASVWMLRAGKLVRVG